MFAAAKVRKVGTTAARSIAGSCFGHLVAEIAAELRNLGEHAQALRLDLCAVRRQARERDAQRAGIGADFLPERPGAAAAPRGIARARAAGRVEERRASRRRTGSPACSIEQPPRPSTQARRHRVAPARGLGSPRGPQHAAGAANHDLNPSVACAIGSMRAPTAAAAPPLRAAGDAREVPWILRRSRASEVAGERRDRAPHVFVRPRSRGPARWSRATVLAVGGGRAGASAKNRELRRHGHAGDRRAEILHEEGHARERPVGQAHGDRGRARSRRAASSPRSPRRCAPRRSMAASSGSPGEICRRRTSSARPVASYRSYSGDICS